jgi:type IV secretion system protein VirB4
MTRANSEQLKHVPWFAKAGAACSIVPISRFVSDHIFAMKGGGYGCFFQLSGMDDEGLTDQELESQLRMIEGSLRGLPEGAILSGQPKAEEFSTLVHETAHLCCVRSYVA